MDEAPEKFPPEEWFAAVADGREQRVAFRDRDGETEFVRAEWSEANRFELQESPLLVDGVAVYDFVEVEWEEGSAEPHYHPHDVPMKIIASEIEIVRPEPTEASPS